MAQAGQGIAEVALACLPQVRGARVLVLVGPGNNGGDGLVVARHLHDAGARVTVYVWRRTMRLDDWPRADTLARGIPEVDASADSDRTIVKMLATEAVLIVDALLGIGLTRPLDEDICGIVNAVNAAGRTVLAVDMPTGIQSDTGAMMGCALAATQTAVAGVLKPGLLLPPGATYAGDVRLVPIGLPERLENETMAETMHAADISGLLPARPADSHKGTFGKVLVVAGSGRYPGAAYLSARAAARTGAGLVTLATGRSIYGALVAASHETTFLPLPEEEWGVLGTDAAGEVHEAWTGYQALVVGPGLGQEDAVQRFLLRLLKIDESKTSVPVGFVRPSTSSTHERKPTTRVGFVRKASQEAAKAEPDKHADETSTPTFVIDADALNLLAKSEGWSEQLQPGTAILTPHPGEMARLLGLEGPAEVNADRLGIARRAAAQWKQIVVLKGAGTVVADPDGRTAIGPVGNPALATAGTGDVLAGIIGGLLAQGLESYDAARLGVYLHASAGRIVRDEIGEAGAIAGDLLDRIPHAITTLRGTR